MHAQYCGSWRVSYVLWLGVDFIDTTIALFSSRDLCRER